MSDRRTPDAKALAESQKDMMTHYVNRIAFWTGQCELRESALKKAEARVAELEAASGGNSSAILTSSTAASGGGESIGRKLAERLGRFADRLESGELDMPNGLPPAASGRGEGEP